MLLLLRGGLLRGKLAGGVGMSLEGDHFLGHLYELPAGSIVFGGLDHVAHHVVVIDVRDGKVLSVGGIDVAVFREVQAGSGLLVDGELLDDEIDGLLLLFGVGVIFPGTGEVAVVILAVVHKVPLHLVCILAEVHRLGCCGGESGGNREDKGEKREDKKGDETGLFFHLTGTTPSVFFSFSCVV
ncbi:hypothetical protein SDC9_61076 [bioreactor metagenome]|uniref:Uncharacterized protein n=1 Tax=bioreactor metagenome TaxID=1076179 RepID=A0A644XET6_9ZZZZ